MILGKSGKDEQETCTSSVAGTGQTFNIAMPHRDAHTIFTFYHSKPQLLKVECLA